MIVLCNTLQADRSIYDAASRAAQYQRNPDGTVKTQAAAELPAWQDPDAAGTEQALCHVKHSSCVRLVHWLEVDTFFVMPDSAGVLCSRCQVC